MPSTSDIFTHLNVVVCSRVRITYSQLLLYVAGRNGVRNQTSFNVVVSDGANEHKSVDVAVRS